MPKTIDIKKLPSILEAAFIKIKQRKDFIEIPAMKEAERGMKRRIHNKGLDSEGKRIGIKSKLGGKYTKSYEKRKTKIVGKTNIYPINLQLRGDLIKGYTTGKSNNRNVLEFQDELSKKKAERHEQSYNTEIYKPSAQELEDMKEVYLLQFEEVMKEVFGNL